MRLFTVNAFSVPILSICAQYSTAAVISSQSTPNVTPSISPSSSLGTTTHGPSTSKPLINTFEPSQSSTSTSAIQSPVTHANTPVSPSPSTTFSSDINGGLSTTSSSTSADLSTVLGSSSSSSIAISIITSTTLPPTDASTILNGSGTTVVPPDSATESFTQTSETTYTASLTSSQSVPISPVDTSAGNTATPSHPSTSTPAVDDPASSGSPVPPIPVATSTQPGSSQSHTTNVITSFNPTENPASLSTISNNPSTSPEITASLSLSSISSEFVNILSVITSWEDDPRPPLQTGAIDQVDSIKDEVEDLISKIGGDSSSSSSSCTQLKLKKRGLIDDMFDVASGTVDELVSGLSCISDEMGKLAQEIELGNTEAVRGVVSTLVSQSNNPSEDEDNNDNDNDTSSTSTSASTSTISSSSSASTSESSSSTSTSTSCTSDTTVHHVTILCEPTPVTSGDLTISTTITCSPSTTITTSGCSVTETTTTVTSTPTPTSPQVCALGACGDSCSVGGGAGAGPVAISTSIDCANIPIATVTALPSDINGADSGIRRRGDGDGVLRLSKRVDGATSELIPDIETVDQKARQTVLSRLITAGNGWLNHAPFTTTGKWYPMTTAPFTAAGVKGLYGCTSIVIISKLGAYISHIYEVPVFKYYDSDQNLKDTEDAVFQDASFGRLRDGRDGVENGLAALVGVEQDGTPSGLNAAAEPQVFVITPFENGEEGAFQYDARARWLGEQAASLIYGNADTGFVGPIIRGYQRTNADISESDEEIYGRAIVEYAVLNRIMQAYVPESNEVGYIPYARWRLWAGGRYVVDNDFTFAQQPTTSTNMKRDVETGDGCEDDDLEVVEGGNAKRAVGVRVRRQSMNDLFDEVCPGYWDEITSATTTTTATQSQSTTFVTTTKTTSTSTPSSTSTFTSPSTSSSTSESTPSSPSTSEATVTTEPEPISTSTKATLESIATTTKATASAINSNPPGQPPSFTLPTAEPTATASPEPTIGEQQCWKSSLFSHKDVIPPLVNELAEMCIYGKITDNQMDFGPEDEPLSWDNGAPSQSVGYVEISWVEGCEGPSQNPVYPAKGYDCKTLLLDNWESCDSVNGGAGGYRTVGCLRYMFMSQLPSVWYPDWS